MFKVAFMRGIAKGLVFGKTATANGYCISAAQVVNISIFIYNLKISLNSKRAIAIHCNFRCCHN